MSALDVTTRISLRLAFCAVGAIAAAGAGAGYIRQALADHDRRIEAIETWHAESGQRDLEIIARLSRIETRLDALIQPAAVRVEPVPPPGGR
jgi:hypothetical protein